jgi:hypothetical protein
MEEMENVKKKIKAMDAKEGQAEAMLRALNKLEEEIQNTAPRKGDLKRDKSDAGNGRRNAITWDIAGVDKPLPEPAERKMRKRTVAEARLGHVFSDQKDLEVGHRVKILTKMFGRQYAQGREEYSYGRVVNVKEKMVDVLYEEDNVEWKSHETHLTKVSLMAMPEDTMAIASGSRPIFHAYINGGARV